MSDTHMIYWDMFPTIDHLVPIARGGLDIESNMITSSMIRNSTKSNWTINEIGWSLLEIDVYEDWDGLVKYFLELTNKNPEYKRDGYVRDWKKELVRVISDK